MSLPLSARRGSEHALSARRLPEALTSRPAVVIAVTYLALITVAELVTTFSDPRVGLVLHGGLLVIVLAHAALASQQPYHRLVLCLVLAPLTRILSLALPLADFDQIYWYLIISIPLFVATALLVRLLGFSRQQIGLSVRKVPLQLLVALTGITFGIVEYFILRPGLPMDEPTWQGMFLSAMVLMICTGFAEELIFRGLLQRTSVQVLGRFGLLYVAILFAVLHIGYRSAADVAFVFCVALLFGWVAEATWSLVGVTLAHGLTNIVLFLVMPFLMAN
jgi:membrane protease YdiL (CAAX protease family)